MGHKKGKKVIKLHTNPQAIKFYKKLGYKEMEFNDKGLSNNTIDLGKIL